MSGNDSGESDEGMTRTGQPTEESAETVEQGRSSADGRSLQGRFWVNTLIGSMIGFVVGTVLFGVFVPIYFLGIIAGSFLAGLFHRSGAGRGALIGGVSGFLATIPFVILLVAAFVVGLGGVLASGPLPPELAREGSTILAGTGVIGVLIIGIALVANIIFGVIGGVVGGAVAGK